MLVLTVRTYITFALLLRFLQGIFAAKLFFNLVELLSCLVIFLISRILLHTFIYQFNVLRKLMMIIACWAV